MRVLFLAPWFRTLANNWARELIALGLDVLVVTTENHFQPLPPRRGEIVLAHRPRSVAGAVEFPRLLEAVRRFSPDVVLAEQFRDPRLAFVAAAHTPHVLMVHDADPHDETHAVPWQKRLLMGRIEPRVVSVVTFSRSVARIVQARNPHRPVTVIPLPSEMSDDFVPQLVPPDERSDFFCVGRLRPYKNLALVADAWEQHVRSQSYRGDTLRILGSGELGFDLPTRSEWVHGTFAFEDVAPQLAAGKASIALYSSGSQSGAQIFSMQVGCPPIVSTVGGLREYQLPALPPLSPTDVTGLVAQLAELSDPVRAAALGAASMGAYRERFSAEVSAAQLAKVLERAIAG